jgi:hypothetical protein
MLFIGFSDVIKVPLGAAMNSTSLRNALENLARYTLLKRDIKNPPNHIFLILPYVDPIFI